MGLFSFFGKKTTRAEFAQIVIDAMRARGESAPITFDEATFALRVGDTDPKEVVNLGNFFHQYEQAPRGERANVVTGFLRSLGGTKRARPKWSEAQHRLLPHLRGRCYWSFSALSARANGIEPFLEPLRLFGADAGIGLVLDYPDMMSTAGPSHLAEWGIDAESAFVTALANLRARTESRFRRANRGVHVSLWKDTYDAARILLPDLIAALPVRGRHVALIPNRDLLILTGDADVDGLTAAAKLAESALDEAQAISARPLVFEDGDWQPFALPPEHPAAAAYALLAIQQTKGEYDEQKELLNAVHAKEDDPPFVASFSGTRAPDATVTSFCSWTEGIAQLLPKTDSIGFVRVHGTDAKMLGFARWDDVAKLDGLSLKETGDYPPRFIASGFPTDAQLRALPLRDTP
ncbi:MAG TPA: hypothetical protein VFN10_12720 [Thermoanaerobaculia bacterium]|nr:hypothetical protein [Thermoanaerobaculia bacterium]